MCGARWPPVAAARSALVILHGRPPHPGLQVQSSNAISIGDTVRIYALARSPARRRLQAAADAESLAMLSGPDGATNGRLGGRAAERLCWQGREGVVAVFCFELSEHKGCLPLFLTAQRPASCPSPTR